MDSINSRYAYYTSNFTHAGYFEPLILDEVGTRIDSNTLRFEVVAVSRSTLSHADFNRKWKIKMNQTATEWEETTLLNFYNVLLVEWKDGIASRSGVGVVFEKAWEEQAEEGEWIDLVLG